MAEWGRFLNNLGNKESLVELTAIECSTVLLNYDFIEGDKLIRDHREKGTLSEVY